MKLQKNITSARGIIPALRLFMFNPHPNVGHGDTTQYSSRYENIDKNRVLGPSEYMTHILK